ncbi:MAG: hypothetical protein Q4F24_12775 [Eubacteriales bacterium]|nr:hypothetical protein [Eubacteriales bacterium]
MKKRKMSSVFSILKSNRGESLTETLVAMLIISLSMAFLASNIAVSVRMGKTTAKEDVENLNEWNQAERAIRGVDESGITKTEKKIIVEVDGVEQEYNGIVGTVEISPQNGGEADPLDEEIYYTYWLKNEN